MEDVRVWAKAAQSVLRVVNLIGDKEGDKRFRDKIGQGNPP